MAVLPGVLGCRPLRRTVQVRLGTNPAVPRDELPGGTPILFALAALRSVPQAGSQFRGLATAIHEISGLKEQTMQVTDKRIHQVKLELSLKECKHLRKAIDHYLMLYDLIDDPERIYPPLETDLDTLKAMSSHLKLVETATVVEEIGL